ncbi:MAG TPA: hydrogenase expression/formation protein HypE [Candidatus Moranbacteria bacterium]|nr:hydrogenase expression/formation protein HypE [Candidatus Moranbacteria bacterium]
MEKEGRKIELESGAGGEKSNALIGRIKKNFKVKGIWKNLEDDAATFDLACIGTFDVHNGHQMSTKLVFTTDAFIIDPIFFPGGDIGKIAVCGTINDLSVMGAVPAGLSLSLVIEEGFPEKDLEKIMQSINSVCKEVNVPIVTGDTKVTEKGKIDKIEITTSGVGFASKIIENGGARPGDAVIVSGDLGEHAVALLASRFNYRTKIKSDCKPLTKEIQSVSKYLTSCKDPTRGGVAEVLNEIAEKSKVKIVLKEDILPFKKETVAISDLLGIDKFAFPSEGRFVATVPKKDAQKTIKILQKYNPEAKIIGEVAKGKGVYLKTNLGSLKPIEMPTGKLIPRIC